MFLSYWNRAKQRGAVTLISLGPVGHQTPGGILDPHQTLPDGRTHLQQTLDWVVGILQGPGLQSSVIRGTSADSEDDTESVPDASRGANRFSHRE
jgi:hypothetical protein